MKKVFDKAGEKLYSLEEIDEIIAQREKQLGITEEMKKYEEPIWEECEKKASWKKIGEHSSGIPDANFLSPSKEFSVKYASEKSFKDFSCYKLEAQGSKEKAVISEIKKEFSDMVRGYEIAASTPYTWAKRVYDNEEEYPMGFSGIFVIRAADEHVDELVGCYWWD